MPSIPRSYATGLVLRLPKDINYRRAWILRSDDNICIRRPLNRILLGGNESRLSE